MDNKELEFELLTNKEDKRNKLITLTPKGKAESEEDDKKVITDIIRFARMQQKEKSRGILGCAFAIPLVLCCLISGVVGLTSINLNETGFGLLYIILMTITFKRVLV